MAQVSDHYDGSAPSYHEQYDPEKIWTNAEYPANYFRLNKVMRILKSRNVASLYELGAAEGSPIVRIAQELGVDVRASDLSSEMVRLGKENFQRNGLDPDLHTQVDINDRDAVRAEA
ncbi:MAG: class I SAM-dependent methyltransferase, partial [Actinomycetota bacterium]